jgi:hypothetical protein
MLTGMTTPVQRDTARVILVSPAGQTHGHNKDG